MTLVDGQGHIHDAEDIQNRVSAFIGHARFNIRGNVLDSLATVHFSRDGGAYRIKLVHFRDNQVAVVWANSIQIDHVWHTELHMRYSISPDAAAPKEDFIPPKDHLLLSAYPNPFNSSVTIEYNIPVMGNHLLKITDTQGRSVWNKNLNSMSIGNHKLVWDGKDFSGRLVPSGTYFVSLSGNNVKKNTLLNVVR